MKYHLTYTTQCHPEGLEREELPEDTGACTAILVGSLLYPPEGWYSAAFVSCDGRTGEPLASNELWKAWFMFAKQLADDENLSPNKRELCELVCKVVFEALQKTEESGELES